MGKNKSGVPIVVAGNTIYATHEYVPLNMVHLDPDNPRIRFQITHMKGTQKLDEKGLLELIRDQPGYDGLQKSIRKAGGLNDAVIIRHNGLVVEGNSRVTALKTLHGSSKTDARWKKVQVMRLPKDTPEQAIAMLMASHHVAGKTEWRPYAQADQIYLLRHKHSWTLEQIGDETRMSKREIEQYIEAYKYLIDEVLPHVTNGKGRDLLESKWSHALEFVTRKNLAHLRDDPVVRKKLAKLLVENKIKGAEVRQLDQVMQSKSASAALTKDGFKAATEVLKKANPTTTSKIFKQMQLLTQSLGKMKQDDLALLKSERKAQKVLVELNTAVRDVASFAGVPLGGRSA